MRRLLCITAHPDDEAAAFGGALLLYQSRGVKTSVISLTAGEAGRGPEGKSRQEVAELRRAEFARACELLKVSEAEALGYPDSGLYQAPIGGPIGDLVHRIRRFRPQVVITFGPEGATGHSDHSMASICATFAFHWAAREDWFVEQLNDGVRPHRAQKLYYLTSDFDFPGRRQLCLAPTTATLAIHEFVEDKIRAFQAHVTQTSTIVEKVIRQQRGTETYHLAAACRPDAIEMETDLFSSVVDDCD